MENAIGYSIRGLTGKFYKFAGICRNSSEKARKSSINVDLRPGPFLFLWFVRHPGKALFSEIFLRFSRRLEGHLKLQSGIEIPQILFESQAQRMAILIRPQRLRFSSASLRFFFLLEGAGASGMYIKREVMDASSSSRSAASE